MTDRYQRGEPLSKASRRLKELTEGHDFGRHLVEEISSLGLFQRRERLDERWLVCVACGQHLFARNYGSCLGCGSTQEEQDRMESGPWDEIR